MTDASGPRTTPRIVELQTWPSGVHRRSNSVTTDHHNDTCRWSNFWPHRTGLPFRISIGVDLEGEGQRPTAQIRRGERWYPFTVEEPLKWLTGEPPTMTPADLEALTIFLRLNQQSLLAHWHGHLDSAELTDCLIPVPAPKTQPQQVGP
jgi:hypothetical protein